LPKAHVEAPTYASVILAGLLLKLGRAGLLRMLSFFNYMTVYLLVFISLMGIVIGSLVCSFQRDGKAIVAYSSIAHMNFLLLLLVINFSLGKVSRVLLILVHGYCSSLIFLMVGSLFHAINTRKLYFINSLFLSSTMVTAFILLSIVSNFSTPPRAGFVRELSGMSLLFLTRYLFFLALGFYIFYVCYYSLYLFVNVIRGTAYIHLKEEFYFFFYPFIFMLFNLF
jgi:NADH:ubiquinone oxidoreductase subunit 4 (subunit M)